MSSSVPRSAPHAGQYFSFRRVAPLAAALLLAVTACHDPPTANPAPGPRLSGAISSGAIGASPRQFFFLLRDLGPSDFQGTFDASLSPEVSVCLWVDDACQSTALGPVTLGTRGATSLTVDAKRERYEFKWQTTKAALQPDAVYRLFVRVNGLQLGYLDIATGEKQRDLREVNRREFLPLRVGGIVKLAFRIESGRAIPEGMPGRYESDPENCAAGCLVHATPWYYYSIVWGGVELGDDGSYGESTIGFLAPITDWHPDVPPVPAPGSVAIAPSGTWSWRYDQEGSVEIWVDGDLWGHWGGSEASASLAPLYGELALLRGSLRRISE